MTDSITPNLGLTLPTVFPGDQWGGKLNTNFSAIDLNAGVVSAEFTANTAKNLATVAALLADTTLAYVAGTGKVVVATSEIVDAGGFRYQVAASGATDQHVTTAGGVKLYVQAGALGVNVKAFGAVGDGVADDGAEIQAAINASAGHRVVFPTGVYLHSATLLAPKSIGALHLCGEFDPYTTTGGAVLSYSGTGTQLQVGTDDGNPDTTGPLRSVRVSGLTLVATSTATTAILVQNTALTVIEDVKTRNHTGKIIWLRGNVITTVKGCDIQGINTGTGCFGVYSDDQYFGNFVQTFTNNHIYQVNIAQYFSEGRYLLVQGNIYENIKKGSGSGTNTYGVFQFASSGYISNARFLDNYSESQQGYVFEGSGFTGAILLLVVRGNEFWGSADAANINPGFGNIPKAKVLNHSVADNFIPDTGWNVKASLALPSVFPTTNIFDPTTTVIASQVTNQEYMLDLRETLRETEILKGFGDFSMVSGGAAGSMTITAASAPTGWTDLAAPDWQLIADSGISGTFVTYVPAAGDFDRCERSISLTPVSRARHFAVAFTSRGWVALRADGTPIYDSGSNVADYHTEVVTFSIAANAAATVLKFGTNSGNPFYLAEVRLYEVGAAEITEPGTLNSATTRAIKGLMKRGAY